MRKAGAILKLFGQARHYGVPGSAMEALGRFGPDLLFSGLYATSMPKDYANTPERIGLMAEDFASQAIPGVLAAGLGGLAARRLGVSPRLAGQIAGGADMTASIAVPMFTQQMGLRPVSAHLDERARKNAELQAQLEREGIFQQGLQAAAQGLGQTPMVEGIDNTLFNLYGQG